MCNLEFYDEINKIYFLLTKLFKPNMNEKYKYLQNQGSLEKALRIYQYIWSGISYKVK